MPRTLIKNLIFDLGGVIIDLSVISTLESFAQISGLPQQEVQRLFISAPEFEQYERGELDDIAFREFIRKIYKVEIDDETLDACWNAMLLQVNPVKLKLLDSLKNRYNTYLLSNTNGIHLKQINEVIMPRTGSNTKIDDHFHKAYYSHNIKMRKPDPVIYKYLLEENNMIAEETLFFDDNVSNLVNAASLGIEIVHVTDNDFILNYFHE